MPYSQVRVVGSGYTSINYNGRPIKWCSRVDDSGQTVGQGASVQAITPLGYRHPIEIATPRFLGMGTLTFYITELWEQPAWWQMEGLEGTENIIDVFERLGALEGDVTATKFIKPPGRNQWFVKTYHGVVITDLGEGETVEIAGMTIDRTIRAGYTHTTRSTISAGSVMT